MTDTIRPLAAGFPPRTEADWRPLAEKALRGAGFDETLGRETADGLKRGPAFFDRPEGCGAVDTAVRDLNLPWGMRQTLVDAEPVAANQAALDDLMGGVSELELRLDPSGKFGLAAPDVDALDTALKGVDMSLAPIHLDALAGQADHADALLALFARRRMDGDTLRGGLGLSPIELAAVTGTPLDTAAVERLAAIGQLASTAFPGVHIVRSDARFVHEAGGSEVEELGVMAASAAAYMRVLIDAGLSADQAARSVEIRLAVDADIHLGIAKLRAARRIWSRIAQSYGVDAGSARARIQAVTSGRMLSAKDPWTNLIRNACAGFAATAGGADAITVRPLTDAIGRPTGFGRRVARNLHILLAEESHLGKVTDPAAGSYLHEHLSHDLARAGWALFQEIERQGGLHAVLASGWLKAGIDKTREQHIQDIADGKAIILGVTKFPDLDPKPVETLDAWPDTEPSDTAIAPVRLAARFEEV